MEKIGTLSDRLAVRMVGHFPGPTVDLRLNAPIVSFTFDDAAESAALKGAEIVEAAGGRATYYIAGSLCGTQGGPGGDRHVTEKQCADLVARGHELACHTFSHRKLASMTEAELSADLDRNAAFLTDIDGRSEPRNFAVPFTMATPKSQIELRKRFASSRGGWPGVNRSKCDLHFLRTVELRDSYMDNETTRGAVQSVAREPGWLIFFAHDIREQPSEYGCTPKRFEALVREIAGMGCRLLSVSAAMDELGLRQPATARRSQLRAAQ